MEKLENIHNIADIHDEIDTGTAENSAPAAERETSDEAKPTAVDDVTLVKLISEAEQRGYLRGRNEKIDSLVIDDSINDENSCPSFLAHIRHGFWD